MASFPTPLTPPGTRPGQTPGQRLPEWGPRGQNVPQTQQRGGPSDPLTEPGGVTGGSNQVPRPGGGVSGIPGTPGQGGSFGGPNSAQFRQLFETLLGPSQHNSFGGQVNADMYAAEHGMDPGQVHQQMNASRNYAGKHESLMQYLMSKGYSLEDMGFQDRPDMGKHEFDMDRAGWGTMGQGLNTGYQYDWNNGTKRYAISSDPEAIKRTEQISPEEMAIHQRGGQLAGQGFDTRAKQLYANAMAKAGRTADPNNIQHQRLNLDVLAKRFGIDPSKLSQFSEFNVLHQPPGQARNVTGIPQAGSRVGAGPNPGGGGGGSVTSAIQSGGASPMPLQPPDVTGGSRMGGAMTTPPSGSMAPPSAPSFGGMPTPGRNNFQPPSFSGGAGQQSSGRGSIMNLGNQKQGGSPSFGGGGSNMGGGF